MTRIKTELMNLGNKRKPFNMRTWAKESFQDVEIRKVKRREASRRMEDQGVWSDTVEKKFIQDRGVKIQVVGSDVTALYPSLEAIEVARIVYNAVMETEVKFSGINFKEACRMIALTSSEQECRLGPLKRV
jgi:hypothetical protein